MRRGSIMVVAALVSLIALGGCEEKLGGNRFQIQQVGGVVYLVDQRTGAIFKESRGRLSEIQKYDRARLDTVASARNLYASPVQNLAFSIRTKYRKAVMHYEITVRPVSSIAKGDTEGPSKPIPVDESWASYWERDGNALNFNFHDADGFRVARREISLGGAYRDSATRIVDRNDNLTEFKYEGTLEVDPEDYELIRSVNVTYSLLKPDPPKPKK